MSEEQAVESGAEQPQAGTEQPEGKVFDAEYVEKLRKENAKYRTEAKANADAAKKLAEIEEANKSEAERLSERLAEAEKAAEQARVEALRFRIATKFSISDEDADLFLTGSDEETLTRQAERLASRESDRKKNGNHAPLQGRQPISAAPTTAEKFAAAFMDRT